MLARKDALEPFSCLNRTLFQETLKTILPTSFLPDLDNIMRNQNRYAIIKYVADRLASFFLIAALIPLFVAVIVLLLVNQGLPLFFTQERLGLHNKPFSILKFRTMSPTLPGSIDFDKVNSRITPIGHFLRATSLDELPQLFNILLGHMSFVGPRPLMPEATASLTPSCRLQRHSVRPGLTGLAQTMAYSDLSRRFEIDIKYVANLSLIADTKILINTILLIITGKKTSINSAAYQSRNDS